MPLPSASPETRAFAMREKSRHSRHPHTPILGRGWISWLDYGSLALQPVAWLALLSEQTGFLQPSRAFTSGLSTVWSPAPPPGITTVPTGQSARAGLSPARSSTSFTAPPQPPSRRSPFSRFAGYTVPCSVDFATGRGGLLQLLSASLPSCCRCNPARVVLPLRSVCDRPCCLRPMKKASASGIPFRGYVCVDSLRPDDSLTILRWLRR